MKKTTVHIISHSHWDREWYMPFEQHRIKLVRLIDEVMELFEKDENFRSFHLDSQTIVLDDYLEIRPQNREKLGRFIREGRFIVGPWYILQDEFLTSGEANVRNLLTGMREAEEFGVPCRAGYFPDAFGNAGQMPQLLKQAGMAAAVFGRGVKPVGFDNQVPEKGDYASPYSEMYWQSPDGSSLPGILFANWYNNGAEIPVEEGAAKAYWDERLADARQFAGTSQLLFMNGCDHQPAQKNLDKAIAVARELYPDIEFVHSDFPSYIEAVCREMGDGVITVKGELTSQETDGLFTLVNTTSARVDQKIRNRQCETALEKGAEPLSVFAYLKGMEYPEDFLRYSWKVLMQNHPHDSICGCSVNQVHEEMAVRFEKSIQVAQELLAESGKYLASRIGAGLLEQFDHKTCPFVVFNTTGWEKSQVVSVVLDWHRIWGKDLTAAYQEAENLELPRFVLKDSQGNPVEASVEDIGVSFGYTLPEDRFRQTYMARQVRVTFEAKVPCLGYTSYVLEASEVKCGQKTKSEKGMVTGPLRMENEYVKVELLKDGSYTLIHKETGKRYPAIGWYEECGDIGNEYIFVQPKGSFVITTKDVDVEWKLVENTPWRGVYEAVQRLEVPARADGQLEKERNAMVNIHDRLAQRGEEKAVITFVTRLTLEKSAKGLKVETAIENTAKDHRIRVVFPTGLRAKEHYADSNFEVVKRPNRHGEGWKNPSGCEHQQNFVAMCDESGGLLAANIGLYEYEILPDQDNAIAVTLLRCVGEMGDWGVFPTPDSQMIGTYRMNYEVVPFAAKERMEACREGYQFQSDLTVCQVPAGSFGEIPPDLREGTLSEGERMPAKASFLEWEGSGLNLTGFKKREGSRDIIVRYVNVWENMVILKIKKAGWMKALYHSDVLERKGEGVKEGAEGYYEMKIRPFEIATFGISR